MTYSGQEGRGGRGGLVQHTPVFLLENSMDREASGGYSSWGRKDLETTELLTLFKKTL